MHYLNSSEKKLKWPPLKGQKKVFCLGPLRLFLIITIITMLKLFLCPSAAKAKHSIKDDCQRVIEFEKPFKRIISLYGAHTENLFSLGLSDEIIGVSMHEDYPPEAKEKATFSYHDDAEKFIAAQPDLILIRPMIFFAYNQLVEKLQKAGITIVSLQPTGIEAMYDYWKKLGALTGRQDVALQMMAIFKTSLERIKGKLSPVSLKDRKRVYFESIHSKMKTFAPESMAIFALRSAGGINVADDAKAVAGSNIANYGKERILAKASNIDVYLAQNGVMNKVNKEMIEQETGFKAIKAVQEDRIYCINEMLVSRPTMRLIQGIYKIGKILYPNLFDSENIRALGKI